jgi:hypothetical protein
MLSAARSLAGLSPLPGLHATASGMPTTLHPGGIVMTRGSLLRSLALLLVCLAFGVTVLAATTELPFTLDAAGKAALELPALTQASLVKIEMTWAGGPLALKVAAKSGVPVAALPRATSPAVLGFVVLDKEVSASRGMTLQITGAPRVMGTAKMTIGPVNPTEAKAPEMPSAAQRQQAAAQFVDAVRARVQALNQAQKTRILESASKVDIQRKAWKSASAVQQATTLAEMQRIDGATGGVTMGETKNPLITKIDPPSAVDGVEITLTGKNFTDKDKVWFVLPDGRTVLGEQNYAASTGTRRVAKVPYVPLDVSRPGKVYIEAALPTGSLVSVKRAFTFLANKPAIESIALPHDAPEVASGEWIGIKVTGIADTPVGTVTFEMGNRRVVVTPSSDDWKADSGVRVPVPQGSSDNLPSTFPRFDSPREVRVTVTWRDRVTPVKTLQVSPALATYPMTLFGIMNDSTLATPANAYARAVGNPVDTEDTFTLDPMEFAPEPGQPVKTYAKVMLHVYHYSYFFRGFSDVDDLWKTESLKHNWKIVEMRFTPGSAPSTDWGNCALGESHVGTNQLHTKINWWNVFKFSEPTHTEYFLAYIIQGPKEYDPFIP